MIELKETKKDYTGVFLEIMPTRIMGFKGVWG